MINVIGGGRMGKAISSLLEKNGTRCTVTGRYDNLSERLAFSEIIFICTKPIDTPNIISVINSEPDISNKLIVSCVSGIPMKVFEGKKQRKDNQQNSNVIRMMANLPIAVGSGTITYSVNKHVSWKFIEKFLTITKGPYKLLVQDEKLLDVSTVLTGCYPAIFAFLAEESLSFGQENGFTKEESLQLFSQTILGTLKILENKSTDAIIQEVCSPGGITLASLRYLESENVNNSLRTSFNLALEKVEKISKN